MKNEIVLSGIRPTGNLHLGNYYGAVRSFVKMQEDYNCYFFIADWHSLTTHPTPENIQKSARALFTTATSGLRNAMLHTAWQLHCPR